jgi:hypothetical protein
MSLAPENVGTLKERWAVELCWRGARPHGVMRVPTLDAPEHFEVRGRKGHDLEVGHRQATTPAEEIVAACDRPLGPGELAEATGMHRTGARFRNGLKAATDSGRLVKTDGLYERATE